MSKVDKEKRLDPEEKDETELEENLRKIGGTEPDEKAIERMRGNIKKRIEEVRKKIKGNGNVDQP